MENNNDEEFNLKFSNSTKTMKKKSSLKSGKKRKSSELNKVKFSKFSNESTLNQNIKKIKTQQTKLNTNENYNHLLCQNFNEIINDIKKNRENTKRSKSSKNPKNYSKDTHKKIISLTNREIINDFYDYTENCMLLITDITPKNKLKNQIPPKDFIFYKNTFRKRICVFDLDETIVHCVGSIKNKKPSDYQNVIKVLLPSKIAVDVGLNVRPNWKESIKKISEKYYIVVYTASHNSYADSVLNFLDPENEIFEYRLYRKDCIESNVNGTKFYVKDLDIFQNFNLKDIIIIDNSVLSFAYHLENGIPIVPYYDSKEDSELPILASYLENIFNYEDLREANKIHIKMHIFLKEAIKEKNDNQSESEEEEEKEEDNDNKNDNKNDKNDNKNDKNNDKNDNKNDNNDNKNNNKNDNKNDNKNNNKNDNNNKSNNYSKSNNNIININNNNDNDNDNNIKYIRSNNHHLSLKDKEIALQKLNIIKTFKEEISTPINKEKSERILSKEKKRKRIKRKNSDEIELNKENINEVPKKHSKRKSKFDIIFNDESESENENEHEKIIKLNSNKKFKRRKREIKTKLQTVMNELHNQFKNSILNINPIL